MINSEKLNPVTVFVNGKRIINAIGVGFRTVDDYCPIWYGEPQRLRSRLECVFMIYDENMPGVNRSYIVTIEVDYASADDKNNIVNIVTSDPDWEWKLLDSEY